MRTALIVGVGLTFIAAEGANAQDPADPKVQAQIAANFDRADANKDGKLSREEFKSTPRAKEPNDFETSFAASDLDKDGVVTRLEFLSLQGITVVSPPPAPAK